MTGNTSEPRKQVLEKLHCNGIEVAQVRELLQKNHGVLTLAFCLGWQLINGWGIVLVALAPKQRRECPKSRVTPDVKYSPRTLEINVYGLYKGYQSLGGMRSFGSLWTGSAVQPVNISLLPIRS